jgi:hypothetical protein
VTRTFVLLAATLGLWGCSSTNFLSKTSTKDKADDGRRPSEQGEGVVGYLRDPGSVEYREEGGTVIVSAPAGAVTAQGDGSVDGLPVCLQQATRDVVKSIYDTATGFGGEGVKTLTDGLVAGDGSFALEVEAAAVDPELLVAVNVAGDCLAPSSAAWSPVANSVVFKDLAGDAGFGGADYYFPELVLAMTGTICTEPGEFDGCDRPFMFFAEDEVGNKIAEVVVSILRADQSAPAGDDAEVEKDAVEADAPGLTTAAALDGDTVDGGTGDAGDTTPSDVPQGETDAGGGLAAPQKLTLHSGATYWVREGEVMASFFAEGFQPVDVDFVTAADWGKTIVLPRE